jgi:hypothetical protein
MAGGQAQQSGLLIAAKQPLRRTQVYWNQSRRLKRTSHTACSQLGYDLGLQLTCMHVCAFSEYTVAQNKYVKFLPYDNTNNLPGVTLSVDNPFACVQKIVIFNKFKKTA